ncbi:hypothetical protein GCM10023094_26320 [Rhodococcus olei]|uniref:Uncharacterized protein n=1 Tax=Rhodococcus olei TaxID=2161675 RepID=A0ABP8P4W5_9NOCA
MRVALVPSEPPGGRRFGSDVLSGGFASVRRIGQRETPGGTDETRVTMIVDCSECAVRDIACGDCVVTVLLGYPGAADPVPATGAAVAARMSIEQDERAAMEALADVGMVPRLRLVPAVDPTQTGRSLSVRDTGVA